MKNFVQPGDVITLTAPSGGVVSGTPYLIGGFLAVAAYSAAEGAEFEGKLTGVYDFPKAASQAWTQGAVVYWDNTAKNFTTTASGNKLAGAAVKAVGNGASETTGRVRLNGVAVA